MRAVVALLAAVVLSSTTPSAFQATNSRGAAPAASQPRPETQRETSISPEQLKAAIDNLGKVDYTVRTAAARSIRRAPVATVVPVLIDAVANHSDGYVQFRALVILSGLNDSRTHDVMVQAMSAKNDRLRTIGYAYFEHNPDPLLVPRMLSALPAESSETVRPALTRTLAAYGTDPRVREALTGLVIKGQDYFRSAVIEAIGDYKGAYALPSLLEVAKLDGPLQGDAVLAIGKIGDKKSVEVLAGLQRTAKRGAQPTIAAAICLLGINCSSHQGYLEQSLKFSMETDGYRDLLRSSTAGLAALGIAGNTEAITQLMEYGGPSHDPARAAIALALGAVALRNTPLFLKVLQARTDPKPAILLLGEAFDMLEEDLDEERFYVTVRRGYWAAPDNSPGRKLAETLIQTLEF
jgi:HEAT repeat protein